MSGITPSSELPKTIHGTPDWTKMPRRASDAPRYLPQAASSIFADTPWHLSVEAIGVRRRSAAALAASIRENFPSGYGVIWTVFDVDGRARVKVARNLVFACASGDLIVYSGDGQIVITHPSERILRGIVDIEASAEFEQACAGWVCPSGTYAIPA